MRTPSSKKPSLVEWDLTSDVESGFGAVVFLAAAPVRIVKEFEPTFAYEAPVSTDVDDWLVTVGQAYAVNQEFQNFKATARRVDDEAHPAGRERQWWRPLD